MNKQIKKLFCLNNIVFFSIILLILINLKYDAIGVMAQITRPNKISLEPGFEFKDLKPMLKNVESVGYLSEKDQTASGNDGRFLMAQYILAPVVLDLNSPAHEINVLDCSTPDAAISVLKIIQAKPIYMNSFGKIIAQRSR